MVNEVTEWFEKRLDEIAEFNPRESLSKGNIAKKISMDKLQPFCRDVSFSFSMVCLLFLWS